MGEQSPPQCKFTGWPCEVVEAVGVGAAEAVGAMLPCSSCRHRHHYRPALAGVRLGAVERWVLLNAAPAGSDDPPLLYDPKTDGHARQVSVRRAIRKLERIGLAETRWKRPESPQATYWRQSFGILLYRASAPPTPWRVTAALSELGAAVVVAAREDLDRGRRIRWAEVLADVPEHLGGESAEALPIPEILAGWRRHIQKRLVFMGRRQPRRGEHFTGSADDPTKPLFRVVAAISAVIGDHP